MSRKYRMIRRRRREALTAYGKRINTLKGLKPRIVVRKSNRGITAQIVAFEPKGDKVLIGVTSNDLRSLGWEPRSNIPTSYLTGMLLAKRAKATAGAQELVLDIGIYKPQKSSVIFAAAKGAADGGLKVLNTIEFDEKRLKGGHIAEYAKSAKGKQFSAYAEKKFDPSKIAEHFDPTPTWPRPSPTIAVARNFCFLLFFVILWTLAISIMSFFMSGRRKCGSVEVILKPAPRGLGVVASEPIKKMLELAGVKDLWSFSRGRTRAKYNVLMATYRALLNVGSMKNTGEMEGKMVSAKEKPAEATA